MSDKETVNLVTKFVAKLGLFVGQVAVMFAQYWFTFGLWPKSWTSFALCCAASIVLITLSLAIEKDS